MKLEKGGAAKASGRLLPVWGPGEVFRRGKGRTELSVRGVALEAT